MLIKPTLRVDRLYVKRGSQVAFDENFHSGINVLFGHNGSGKTSVIQLLMYGLGYEVPNWKDEAGQCNNIFVGLTINGNALTIRRKNNGTEKQSMDFCFSDMDTALRSPLTNWVSFPYAIGSKPSFSQQMFEVLGIPEAKADANNNNITLHQIYRLLYADQSNTSRAIFNNEPFDSAFKRESVGKYLLGLYDNELYEAKIKLVEEEKKLQKIVAKLQAIQSVVGKTSFGSDYGTLDEQKNSILNEIASINVEIMKIKDESFFSYDSEKKETETSAKDSIAIRSKLLEVETEIQQLNYNILDSEDFVSELLDKKCALTDSIKVEGLMGGFKFSSCPSCHKPLKEKAKDCCCLCGDLIESKEKSNSLLRMKNEIEIQLRESEKLLENKRAKLNELINKRKELRTDFRKQISKVTAIMSSVDATKEKQIFELYRQTGELEEKLQTLDKIAELHNSLLELRSERDNVQAEVNSLKDRIDSIGMQRLKREPEINALISEKLCSLLRKDNGAEKEFKDANIVEFDFAGNSVSVNGKTAFSESGTVLLNNAFHVALLMVSLEKKYVRLPRFLVLDGIENGGMEDNRSQNFQKVVVEALSSYEVDFQLVFATKNIDESLKSKKYMVGDEYNGSNKSLKSFS
ncbi:AAA family ATPase [Alishewanella sp. d11]|uniref:AAA family ATPase n=1 Tax=Alishewanella sp. d11 TaxID=3414030 RepID=UPI003BF8862D